MTELKQTLLTKTKGVKDQVPTSNIQGSTKQQTSTRVGVQSTSVRYNNGWEGLSAVNETPIQSTASSHPFDLEERTAKFGELIVRFAKTIPRNPVNNRLIDQLVGCGTSVGANYCEANEGVSRKDFRHIIGRCSKEAKETKFFLRMVAASEPQLSSASRKLYTEAKELHLIFASIFRKLG